MVKYNIGDKVKVPDGYLTYLGDSGKRTNDRKIIGLWQCIDGCPKKTKQFECSNKSITSKQTGSCGCWKEKVTASSIKNPQLIYLRTLWYSIKQRCYNPNDKGYKYYGSKGIKIQDNWKQDSNKFIKDILEHLSHRPNDTYSLDRIDNKGNYELGNIRWATDKEQNNNRVSNRQITIEGITKNIGEWAEEFEIAFSTITARIKLGWSGSKLLKPVKARNTFDSENFKYIWKSIKSRTSKPKDPNWKNYGGRGIKLYDDWEDYNNFKNYILENLGLRLSAKYSLDRIDVNGNYEPGNIQWATAKEQTNNKTTTVWVEYDGKKLSLSDAATKSNINFHCLSQRLRNGWTNEELFLPIQRNKLSSNQIKEIRDKHENEISNVKLAKEYGVSTSTIQNIIYFRGPYANDIK